ncbi:MAG TPA: alkaline phosphatase family protein, partial [Planctomycetota bacterium]|nr:alkaline phosphatase family protein [Planctomycetota bacterium]
MRRLVIAGLALALAAALADVVLLRSFEFIRHPSWIPPWTPHVTCPPPGPPVGAPLAEKLVFVIVDGLRVDTSTEMPELNRLRLRGTESIVRVEFPSFSRVGYANLLTGGGPRVHGYLSNNNRRPCPVPSIMDLARAAGIHTRLLHEHHTWLPAMFPSGFEQVDDLGTADLATLRGGPARELTVIYIAEPDLTAHEFGGASAEYRRRALEVDARLGRIARAVDLTTTALIVVSDHGHIDRGGHGGHEALAMHAPLVAAGPGVDVSGIRRQEGVAVEA